MPSGEALKVRIKRKLKSLCSKVKALFKPKKHEEKTVFVLSCSVHPYNPFGYVEAVPPTKVAQQHKRVLLGPAKRYPEVEVQLNSAIKTGQTNPTRSLSEDAPAALLVSSEPEDSVISVNEEAPPALFVSSEPEISEISVNEDAPPALLVSSEPENSAIGVDEDTPSALVVSSVPANSFSLRGCALGALIIESEQANLVTNGAMIVSIIAAEGHHAGRRGRESVNPKLASVNAVKQTVPTARSTIVLVLRTRPVRTYPTFKMGIRLPSMPADHAHFLEQVGQLRVYQERPRLLLEKLAVQDLQHIARKAKGQKRVAFRKQDLVYQAAMDGDLDFVESCYNEGVEVAAETGRLGRSALHYAAMGDQVGVAQFLLEQGANVNCVDDDEATPLHLAAYMDAVAMTQWLIEHGANVDARDAEDQLPVDHADEEPVIALLTEATQRKGSAESIVALFDYNAEQEDELSFKAGNRVSVLSRELDCWWKVSLPEGQVGLVPSNFFTASLKL